MLLTRDDPAPARVTNAEGASPFVLIGDHAGRLVPTALGELGLPDAERSRHIGWDIGISALGARLSTALGAPFVEQRYSRLVVDCNRGPEAPDAVPAVSDGTLVPGNRNLTDAARAARFAEIHEPYHRIIATLLADRRDRGQETTLVALHSFTPTMRGVDRPWHCGLLHHLGDTRFVAPMLDAFHRDPALVVGDNQPYAMDGIDYSVPRHAYPDLPYIEIEVRQDLLADDAGVALWAGKIAGALATARSSLLGTTKN
jgi:predicted N-formylglutamate amidohydrolase